MKVNVCSGKSCKERFSDYIKKRLESDILKYGQNGQIQVEPCLCQGKCKESPMIILDGVAHTKMNPIKASELIFKPQ